MAVEGTMTEEKTDEKPKRAPRKRAPKPDALVAEAAELARRVLSEEFPQEHIGEHLGAFPEDDRVMTHAFQASKRGYRGWEWFVTLSRAPRAKEVTICEWGLRPAEGALLAPAWIPWAERIRPEELQAAQAAEEEAQNASAQNLSAQNAAGDQADASGDQTGEAASEATAEDASSAHSEEAGSSELSADAQNAEQPAGSHAVVNPAEQESEADAEEEDLTAEEIEASVAVKRRSRRRRRYSTRAEGGSRSGSR